MSDRLLACLLTVAFFLLVAAWIPFLDAVVRFTRRRRQTRRVKLLRRELEAELPNLYRFPAANPGSRKADAHAR